MKDVRVVDMSGETATESLAHQVGALVQRTMMTSAPTASEAVFVGLCAIGGAIEPLSALIGRNSFSGGESITMAQAREGITPYSTLLACLIAAASVRPHKCEENEDEVHMSVEYGPPAALRAMYWFELLTGERPDQYMNERMATAMREFEQEHPEMLDNSAISPEVVLGRSKKHLN